MGLRASATTPQAGFTVQGYIKIGSELLQSSSSSSSSLVLDKIPIPEDEYENEDEYEKYQIQSPQSALIWNYKVSSTIRLDAFQASGGPEPWTPEPWTPEPLNLEPLNLEPWTFERLRFLLDLDRRETYC